MAPFRRKLTIIFAFVALPAGVLVFEQWFAARSFREHHARWLKEQRPVYEQLAAKVGAQRATLSSQPRDLAGAVPRPFTAIARTSADGSITIIFPGGEGGPRHGYIYHSGGLLTRHPGDPDACLYHLTNGWYEY